MTFENLPQFKFYQPTAIAGINSGVALTPEVNQLLATNAAVAVGVSGGKDSQACALAVHAHLNAIGHTGPRLLVHADLGVVEWKDSLPVCERLAEHLGWELAVVRRASGDMLDRWRGRWANNVKRYQDLSCVKLILPWSTPAMRFCTSELKVQPISSALKKRFPGQDIVNVAGIRSEESPSRAKMPVSQLNTRLQRKVGEGITWNAILHWKIQQVLDSIAKSGLALHEAYTKYQASRVSCAYCIMSSGADLLAAAGCEDNHDLYRMMVDLELESTFAFQGARWLADVAPHLLEQRQRDRLPQVKLNALERQRIEAMLPKHLLYTKGWPMVLPTLQEAELIADVRRQVSALVGIQVGCLDAESVLARYSQLLAEKALEDVEESTAEAAMGVHFERPRVA